MDDLISRQQAINKIKPWLEVKGYGWGELNMLRAVINELENLPSVQPKSCEDAVSREAVLSMIDTYMNKSVELHYLPTSDGIKKLISILPSAQPERKKGTWTDDASCPFCGFQLWYERDIHTLSFCPNCGADMRSTERNSNV